MDRLDERININDFPQEILEYIFSFLNIKERIKIERVCKNWRHIGTTIHWKIKEIKYKYSNLTDYMLEEILKRCGNYVLVIDLTERSRLTSKALSLIGDHCPNLRSVKFSHMNLTDSDLGYFSSKCTKLKEAVLICLRYGEDGMISFLKNCQELEVLYNEYNNNISGHCFQFISPKVKELKLKYCRGLMPGFLKLGKCKCIEHLELSYCDGLDTVSLQEVLKQNCNSLKYLGLNGYICPQIDYQALPFELLIKLIANNCQNLRTLNVGRTKVTDMGLNYLTICPLLTTLNVSYAENVTDESIILLAMVGKLESLTIQYNHKITDNACKMLAVHCTKLKWLDLCGCRGITDVTAHSFINAMELRNDGDRKLKIFVFETKIRVFIEEEEFLIANMFPEALGK